MNRHRKWKSSSGKFAKTEEYARWAIRRRRVLKSKALTLAQDFSFDENSIQDRATSEGLTCVSMFDTIDTAT